jgi:hypothetical protein
MLARELRKEHRRQRRRICERLVERFGPVLERREHLRRIQHEDMVPRPDVARNELRVRMLARSALAVETERESVDRPLRDVRHKSAHQARVHAAGQEAAERHVGDQHAFHRSTQLRFELRKRFGFIQLQLCGVVRTPIALDGELALLHHDRVARLELAHAAIHGLRRRNVLAFEVQPERVKVELAPHAGMLDQRLELRAEDER